jgi:AmiR/NasT family two-component response regulator
VTERAKGILMERHQIDEKRAFEILRAQSRQTGRKLVNIAEAIVDSHLMLPATPGSNPQAPDAPD